MCVYLCNQQHCYIFVQLREDTGLPPNAPLLIIADPNLGTAAALTQGNYSSSFNV